MASMGGHGRAWVSMVAHGKGGKTRVRPGGDGREMLSYSPPPAAGKQTGPMYVVPTSHVGEILRIDLREGTGAPDTLRFLRKRALLAGESSPCCCSPPKCPLGRLLGRPVRESERSVSR